MAPLAEGRVQTMGSPGSWLGYPTRVEVHSFPVVHSLTFRVRRGSLPSSARNSLFVKEDDGTGRRRVSAGLRSSDAIVKYTCMKNARRPSIASS